LLQCVNEKKAPAETYVRMKGIPKKNRDAREFYAMMRTLFTEVARLDSEKGQAALGNQYY